MISNSKGVLLLSHLRIQNANAISGPLTWGFPSPTAFTGFVHALGRRVSTQYSITFGGVGIICHQFEPQVTGKHSKVFNLARHPVDKEGNTAALVEEGRVHLEISLVVEAQGYLDEDEKEDFANAILEQVYTMRIAGGSILPSKYPSYWQNLPDDQESLQKEFGKFRRRLLPGFTLVSRQDLLESHLTKLQKDVANATPLDALLDLTRLNVVQEIDPSDSENFIWEYGHKPGWLVPIPIGYGAISPLYPAGKVLNSRDEQTPVRFVESLYSLGQWVSPHRVKDFTQLFWQHHALPEEGKYICINNFNHKESAS